MRLTVLLAFLMAMGCVSSGGWDTERVDDDDATGDDDDATGDDDDATGDDDDATADDDDATGDDDDATADDDDATADDDDATGDDDDATGDDDDSTSAPACGPLGTMLPAAICEAVIWGVDLSFGYEGVALLDQLEAELSVPVAAGCPGYASTTTSPLPPSSGCGPYASWTATQTDEVWTGGCSQGGYTVAGTLGAGYLDTLCKLTSNTTDGLLGAGFDLQWTGAGSAPGLQGLSVDGSLDWRSSYNQNMPPTVETIEIDASVGVVGALSGAVAAAAFPPGQTTVDLFISFADSGAFANAEMIAGDMTVSATARELSAPWVLAGSASWAGPDFMGFGGCMDEPESGVLTVEVWDAPGGSLLGTATLAFDGATACDGCADVSLDGVSVGTWCDSAWELRNPLGPSPM